MHKSAVLWKNILENEKKEKKKEKRKKTQKISNHSRLWFSRNRSFDNYIRIYTVFTGIYDAHSPLKYPKANITQQSIYWMEFWTVVMISCHPNDNTNRAFHMPENTAIASKIKYWGISSIVNSKIHEIQC